MQHITEISEEVILELEDIIHAPQRPGGSAGEKPFEYYLSEEYLNTLTLVDAASFSKLSLIMRQAYKENLPHISSFLKDLKYQISGNLSGSFYYPEDGFMSWHTNFKRKDYRVYFSKREPGEKISYFRYKQNGEIITSLDSEGWSARIFNVGDEQNPFWHCVYGGSGRYSVGFRLKPFEG